MAFRYRCEQCRTTSPPAPTYAAAEEQQNQHRRRAHGGHIPDGERIDPVAGGTDDESRRPLVWLVTLVVLAVVGWVGRRF